MKGSYVLLIQLSEEQTIAIGRLGDVRFPHGHYAYVGSAMGGFSTRLSHHLHRSRKPHWHIDYLLYKAVITGIMLCETEQRTECSIAQALEGLFDGTPGFGSSDCRCRSHLFFHPDDERLRKGLTATLNQLGLSVDLKSGQLSSQER